MPKFEIEIADLAAKELKGMRAFDRRRVVEEVERQLADQPTEVSKNRKRLDSAVPDFEHVARSGSCGLVSFECSTMSMNRLKSSLSARFVQSGKTKRRRT